MHSGDGWCMEWNSEDEDLRVFGWCLGKVVIHEDSVCSSKVLLALIRCKSDDPTVASWTIVIDKEMLWIITASGSSFIWFDEVPQLLRHRRCVVLVLKTTFGDFMT